MTEQGEQQAAPAHRAPTLSLTFARWRSKCLEQQNASEKDTLRLEAKSYFETLIRSTEFSLNGAILKSKSSHNEALAQLIADLGPALSIHHYSRICALHTLCGAVRGCGTSSGVSLKITSLLGKFLLGHCGPIQPDMDDPDDDSDEQVRDAAVLCMSALLRAKVDDEELGGSANAMESIRLALDLSQKGVERRCAAPENDYSTETDYGYGDSAPATDIRGGLSTLPRSRRSLCFDLVRAGVDGVAGSFASIDESNVGMDSRQLRKELSAFASFAATCLHGESDPRCLMQLLQLLSTMQRTFLPRFKGSEDTVSPFPALDVFDAVAPYYPIQFTPPPNDIHGMTRQGLHNELMAVLCNVQDELETESSGGNEGRENMLNLSTGLFLERFLPPDNDGAAMTSTVVDKLEAMEDLSALLFPDGVPGHCTMLHQDTVRDLSSSLVAVHADASSSVSSGGEEGKRNKALADMCRTLVSRVAYELEVNSDSQTLLWDIFVKDSVQVQSPVLSTSPQSMRGRTSVAYLACLAASGGKRALVVCLESCLPPLLEALSSDLHDEEKIAAAAYGIGALFSSYRVARERNNDGVLLHPNPLEAFGSKVLGRICEVLGIAVEELDYDNPDVVFSTVTTRISSISAVESVLRATPRRIFHQQDTDLVCSLIELLTEGIVGGAAETDDSESPVRASDMEYNAVCARTLGSIIGLSLANSDDADKESDNQHSGNKTILEDDIVRTVVRDRIYPRVISSALTKRKSESVQNYASVTLAFASKMNLDVSAEIVGELVKSLQDALVRTSDGKGDAEVSAMALSYVLRQGTPHAVTAFHELSSPSATPIDMINAICKPFEASATQGGVLSPQDPLRQSSARVSMLELPVSSEESEEFENAVQRAYKIIPFLLPAFETTLPQKQLLALAKHASQLLPPISEWENIKLYVTLPLLAASLSNGLPTSHSPNTQDSNALNDILTSMAPTLTEYILSSSYDERARSAAASCLHSIITEFQISSDKECLSYLAMKKYVLPAVSAVAEEIRQSNEQLQESCITAFKDAINLSALLGSAAACRGKSSSKVANEIALFLIQLSCTGKVNDPVNMDISHIGSDKRLHWSSWPALLYLLSASAFGSMLSVENGGPFWRQRVSHLAMTSVFQACTVEASSASTEVLAPPVGALVVACHIVCSSEPSAVGQSNMEELASIILRGLVVCTKTNSNKDNVLGLSAAEIKSTKELVLATTIKLMSVAPEPVSNHVPAIMSIFLILFGEDEQVGAAEDVPLKLLVLQGLLNLATLQGARRSCLPFKQAVLSLLSEGLDNSSALLRHAAVDVSNAWYILKA